MLLDLMRVTLYGSYLGQETLNVFFYSKDSDSSGTGAANDAESIAEAFNARVVTALLPLINAAAIYTGVKVEGVYGNTDFGEISFAPRTGTFAGEPMPSFVAHAFRLTRPSNTIRHGQKRFAGVAETQSNGNTQNIAVNIINAVTDALTAPLDGTEPAGYPDGPGTGYVPVLASFILQGQERLEPFFMRFTTAAYRGVTTQNTRKPGRGR